MTCLALNLPVVQAGSTVYARTGKALPQETSKELGDEVAALPVVRPLVLEPLSVSLHATDLLAVVVGDGIRNRVGRGVHAESSDAVEEFFLFLQCRRRMLDGTFE